MKTTGQNRGFMTLRLRYLILRTTVRRLDLLAGTGATHEGGRSRILGPPAGSLAPAGRPSTPRPRAPCVWRRGWCRSAGRRIGRAVGPAGRAAYGREAAARTYDGPNQSPVCPPRLKPQVSTVSGWECGCSVNRRLSRWFESVTRHHLRRCVPTCGYDGPAHPGNLPGCKLCTPGLSWASCGWSALIEQAAGDRSAGDPFGWSVGDRMVGPGWPKLPPSVRPLAVVMPGICVEHVPKLAFTEDQQPVGELDPGSEHEPLGVRFRPGGARRDLHNVDPGVGEHRVEGDGELSGPVPDQILEVGRTLAQVEQARLRRRAPRRPGRGAGRG
jgi:hypothetical protein